MDPARHIALPSALHLGWALLLVSVPHIVQRSLPFMLHFGYAVVMSGTLALGWGPMRTALKLVALRVRHTPGSAPIPA